MKNAKQYLSVFMCIIMCFSMLSTFALAEESTEIEFTAEVLSDGQITGGETEEPAQLPESGQVADDDVQSSGTGDDSFSIDADLDEADNAVNEEVDPGNQSSTTDAAGEIDAEVREDDYVEPSEEINEEAAGQAADTAEVTPVIVIFNVTPEDAVVTVYTEDDADASEEMPEVVPEEDGTYLLPPGKYYYSVVLNEEYENIEKASLTITEDDYPECQIVIYLEAVTIAEDDINANELKDAELEDELELSADTSGFEDVSDPSAYYYTPVYWAVDRGITAGTSPTTFSPGRACTRGQIVTFLWKALGSPEPTSYENPFTDVSSTDYFYKPVLWAKENGVTSGTSKTTFSPGKSCTRGQIVTFLWKALNSPEPSSTNNPFTDVKESDYFCKPVLWAKENSITSGTSATNFSPGNSCTRGQAMTFLYKAINLPPPTPPTPTADFVYEDITSDTVRLVKYNGTDSSVTVPETHDGKTVTEIGPDAFLNNTTLTDIDLPDTIKIIGARAFKGCTNLSSMT